MHSERNIKPLISTCFQIFNEYSWLTNAYVLDFYTKHHWDKILKSWKSFVEDLPLETVGDLLHCDVSSKLGNKILPLSLLCLRKLLNRLCIPRELDVAVIDNRIEIQEIFNANPKLVSVFWKQVKFKKQHEITRLSKICYNTAVQSKCSYIVDIGSGLGHLSRTLSYVYGLNVLSIEADEKLTQTAWALDMKFKTAVLKYLNDNKVGKVVYITKKIETHTTSKDIQELVKNHFNLSRDETNFGIVGLHPCGDLATSLMKYYRDNPNIRCINIVNCCYMKLTSLNSSLTNSFPLSTFCKNARYNLSYNSREVACHATEMYMKKLKSDRQRELKVHAFRAALEKVIVKSWPQLAHSQLSNTKYQEGLEFLEYCKLAVKKIGIVLDETSTKSPELLRDLDEWRNVVKFYTLRLMIAPLIESIILYDRILYLQEQGGECTIVPAFDPMLSPRNHVIIAVKQQCNYD